MKKRTRGNGEGSIYPYRGGYAAAVSVDGGKRKVYLGKTRVEVSEKLNAALVAKRLDQLVIDNQTVEEFLIRWLEKIRVRRAPNTYRGYAQAMKSRVIPVIGKIRLDKLRAEHIDKVVTAAIARGNSATTVHYTRRLIITALESARKSKYVSGNVAKDSEKVMASERFKPMFLTREQARAFLDAAKSSRLYALYVLALLCGMRQGELLGLKWSAINLDRKTLEVNNQLVEVRGTGIIDSRPKTSHSVRTIQLPELAAAALRQRRVLQLEERLAAGQGWVDTGYVFTAEATGLPMWKMGLTDQFKVITKAIGLPVGTRDVQGFRFHDLRHTCASLLLQDGVPVKVVSDLLGHANIRITLDLYGHVYEEDRKEVADRADRLLG